MRCTCCNNSLTDYECTLKSIITEDYLDICIKCISGLNIQTKGNGMLKKKLDEQEAAYDEWNEFDEYDVDIHYKDDICIDYSMIEDDNDEETC